jgi:hypothetical protein
MSAFLKKRKPPLCTVAQETVSFMMLKMMLDKKIQEGLEQAAQMLSSFPYHQWT